MIRQFFTTISMTALFAAVFTSCDTMVLTDEDSAGQIEVNLQAGIKPASTYATNDQWEVGDKVGLYMKRTGQTLTTFGAVYRGAANVQMGINGQTLTSTPPLMYPANGNVDFVAYYPYTPSSDLTIPVSVAGQSAGLPVEVLYSNNVTNQAPTDLPVTLNFKYSFAKIELTVTGGANSNLNATDFAAASLTVEGLFTQAKFQLSNGTFTDYQDKQPVTLHRKGGTTTSATFEALVLPTNEAVTFLFNVGGSVYRHQMASKFASDTLYKYNFALDFIDFSQDTVKLLNAVIIPRGESPQQNIPVDASKQMTMTTAASQVSLNVGGTGKMTIDWGDGTPCETYTVNNINYEGINNAYMYCYSSTSSHIITITGENIMYLGCAGNQLTSLDASKNTLLTQLVCFRNQLTSLDVSNNTLLTSLNCGQNLLTDLDVSKNTVLTRLECYSNLLSVLNISKNTALTYFDCRWNKLPNLDLSKNIALTLLWCNGNHVLRSLDVSKNTALTSLSCKDNQLVTLDVSKNTTLTNLSCDNNQLDTLDISKNTALNYLSCCNIQLKSLDLSEHSSLVTLSCSNNQLKSLDLRKNTALELLDCQNNQLMELDVSNNTVLTALICSDNLFGTAELDALFHTLHNNTVQNKFIGVERQSIYIGGNPGTNTCNRSIAEVKGWTVIE